MLLRDDTLYVADADGIHAFHRRSGIHLAFVDLRSHRPGFLNDLAAGPDGALYVTDTEAGRVFRIGADPAAVAIDLGGIAPNGITWDSGGGRFLLASWREGPAVLTWDGINRPGPLGDSLPGGVDGIEVVAAGILVASQTDSALYLLSDGSQRRVLQVAGRPADIGIDTCRGRVAVPYVALNRVDIWPSPDHPMSQLSRGLPGGGKPRPHGAAGPIPRFRRHRGAAVKGHRR